MIAPTRSGAVLVTILALGAGSPAGAGWQPNGSQLCAAPGDQYGVGVIPDDSGGAFVTWVDTRRGGFSADVYVTRVTRLGDIALGWPSDGLPLCTAPGDQFPGDIVSDGAGGGVVGWDDGRVSVDGDVYAQRFIASGAVEPGWPVDGIRLTEGSLSPKSSPLMASDGAGGAFLVWTDYAQGSTEPDLFIQHVTSAGSLAPGWPPSALPLCTAPGQQLVRDIAPDGLGGAIVVWEDHRGLSSSSADVYAQHVDAAGAVVAGWPSDGRPICAAAGPQTDPRALPDGVGGAFFCWRDHRVDIAYGDVYASRMTGGGSLAVGWPADGKPVCTLPGIQWDPKLASDGVGGAFIVWADGRSGDLSETDIYAVRLDPGGAVAGGWTQNGRPVCGAVGFQDRPVPMADGAGGAMVFWIDRRFGRSDLYAQRLSGSGELSAGWPPDGVPVCESGAVYHVAGAAPGDSSGALVVWNDLRSGVDVDLYAQRVTAAAVAGPGRPAPSDALRLLGPRPNPAGENSSAVLEVLRPVRVLASILDLAGREVRTLAHGEILGTGSHTLAWDGRDRGGRRASAGVYFLSVRAPAQEAFARIVLLGGH